MKYQFRPGPQVVHCSQVKANMLRVLRCWVPWKTMSGNSRHLVQLAHDGKKISHDSQILCFELREHWKAEQVNSPPHCRGLATHTTKRT